MNNQHKTISFMRHRNTESWDRLLAPLVGLGGGLIPGTSALAGIGKRVGTGHLVT